MLPIESFDISTLPSLLRNLQIATSTQNIISIIGGTAKPKSKPSIEPKETARDGNFIAYDNGIVYDAKTGFEWFIGPDKGTNLDEAKAWVEGLIVDGGGWRMPTRENLKTLYQKGEGRHNITSLLKPTGRWIWLGETKSSSSARLFNFDSGRVCSQNRNRSTGYRAFAVRSRKKEFIKLKNKLLEAKVLIDKIKPKETGRDGNLIAYDNGMVYDTKTDLEWLAGPNNDMNWDNAKEWVDNLSVDGGGWRMPTRNELGSLYQRSTTTHKITPLLKTTVLVIWSGETQGSSKAWCFHFGTGDNNCCNRHDSCSLRVFAVRSRKMKNENLSVNKSKSIKPQSKPTIDQSETNRDGNFITYDNGIVYDTKTNLEWFVGPNKGTAWNEAKKWVDSLDVDGGEWRMPTPNELKNLYKRGAGDRNMILPLKTTGWWVWSGQTKGSSEAWAFDFSRGDGDYWNDGYDSIDDRVFAIRLRKRRKLRPRALPRIRGAGRTKHDHDQLLKEINS